MVNTVTREHDVEEVEAHDKGLNFSLKMSEFKERIIPYKRTSGDTGTDKGVSHIVKFQIAPEVTRLASEIVEWGKIGKYGVPYKSGADLARDGYYKWVAFVHREYDPKNRRTMAEFENMERLMHDYYEGEKMLLHDTGFQTMLKELRVFKEDGDLPAILARLAKWITYSESAQDYNVGWFRHFVKTLVRNDEIIGYVRTLEERGYADSAVVQKLEGWYAEWGKK